MINLGHGFSSGHVWTWEFLSVKKAECWRTDAFERWCWRRPLRVPWTARRSNQSILNKGDQSWVFFGRTDGKAETPVLWPPHVKTWLIGKDSDAGRDWGQEEKGTAEDEMAGWHHRLNGCESEWTPGVGDGQACCNPWDHKELDPTERLNWTDAQSTSQNYRVLILRYTDSRRSFQLSIKIIKRKNG